VTAKNKEVVMSKNCPEILPGCAREFGEIKEHLRSHGDLLESIKRVVVDNGLLAKVARHDTIIKFVIAVPGVILAIAGLVFVILNYAVKS